jgi:hypothetical protein
VTNEVTNDYHLQLLCRLVVNDKIGLRANIKLKVGRVKHKKGIPFVSLIWLWAVGDMVMPQIMDCFRFYDPVEFRGIRSFQLGNIESRNLRKALGPLNITIE